MILLRLKHYIKSRQQVSAEDIAIHFDLSEDALEGLLQPLLKQGHIIMLQGASCSSGCGTGCASQSASTTYQWLDKKRQNLLLPIEVH